MKKVGSVQGQGGDGNGATGRMQQPAATKAQISLAASTKPVPRTRLRMIQARPPGGRRAGANNSSCRAASELRRTTGGGRRSCPARQAALPSCTSQHARMQAQSPNRCTNSDRALVVFALRSPPLSPKCLVPVHWILKTGKKKSENWKKNSELASSERNAE